MKLRENLLAVMRNKLPEIIPWFADMRYWHYARKGMGDLDEKYQAEDGLLQLHQDTGVGIFFEDPAKSFDVQYEDSVELVSWEEGKGETKRLHYEIRTPIGSIRKITGPTEHTPSPHPIEHYLKTPKDLPILRYVVEHEARNLKKELFVERARKYGQSGLPFILLPQSPFSRMMEEFSIITQLIWIIEEAPEEFEKTLRVMEEKDEDVNREIMKWEFEVFEWGDCISSELWSERYFRRYAMPYYQRWTEKFHQTDKKCGVHIDGTLRGILELLTEAGMDFAESVTPSPCGDAEVEELRALAGPELILSGGLPGAIFSPTTKEEYFREFVKKVILCFKEDGKAILSSADQVPPDANLSRVKMVTEMVQEYGRI